MYQNLRLIGTERFSVEHPTRQMSRIVARLDLSRTSHHEPKEISVI
jgi:hypothetical protein